MNFIYFIFSFIIILLYIVGFAIFIVKLLHTYVESGDECEKYMYCFKSTKDLLLHLIPYYYIYDIINKLNKKEKKRLITEKDVIETNERFKNKKIEDASKLL